VYAIGSNAVDEAHKRMIRESVVFFFLLLFLLLLLSSSSSSITRGFCFLLFSCYFCSLYKRLLLLLLFCYLFYFMEDRRPVFVLFGDSITQQGFSTSKSGWAAQLADVYQQKVDVINRGFSGYTTRWAVRLLPKIFPLVQGGHHPSLVVVFFGANDSCLPSSRQHVPLEEYSNNLIAIVRHLKAADKVPHVLLVTPPPIDAARWAAHKNLPEHDRELSNTSKYAQAAREVASRCDCYLLDLFAEMTKSPTWNNDYFFDGLHLNDKGNTLLYEQLMKTIAVKVSALIPDKIPFPVPYWGDIKPDTQF